MSDDRDDNSPITSGQLLKWGGVLLAVVTTIISLVWFAATLQREITTLQVDDQNFRVQQAIDDARRDKRLDENEHQNDDLKKSISDLKTELEVAVTILHRLDERMPEKQIDQ
jgi:cell division protein FtsL